MLFCPLGRADSLREICHGLACCVGKLAHLGIGRAPTRSTLSYASRHRPAVFFEALFCQLADDLRAARESVVETAVPLQEQAAQPGLDHH